MVIDELWILCKTWLNFFYISDKNIKDCFMWLREYYMDMCINTDELLLFKLEELFTPGLVPDSSAYESVRLLTSFLIYMFKVTIVTKLQLLKLQLLKSCNC